MSISTLSESLHLFGQLVIGPPGSGKTTYCNAMAEFLTNLGRKVEVINLDPANESLPYRSSIDVNDLIRLDEVMDYLGLGPNGGLVYCMEYLYTNRDWLATRLFDLKQKNPKCYLIFDCPGQVELYTHHSVTRQLVSYLTKRPQPGQNPLFDGVGLQLTAVHLVDSHYCSDPGKFISCLLTSLAAMLQLGLPHVNILSKADLVEQFGELDFNLDFFTEVLDLQYLVDKINKSNDPFLAKYERLNQALIGVIQDQSLVQFLLLDIQNMSHMERVMRYVDRANGYVFGPTEQHNLQAMMHMASGVELCTDWIGLAQERYMSSVHDDGTSEPEIDFFA
ncbi:GPN-loop GTPase [Fasciola gigantica]|uniref:GPN-loop GTPase 2 n=1 Tax=Fasciola gigantica TaxID=46835 RepID=A0A504YMC6_FASGI|nr:GPN-loop GTPase [Fasciola gigantica]